MSRPCEDHEQSAPGPDPAAELQHELERELQHELQHELERTADRLRVVGPRLDARGTARAHSDLAAIRAALQALADLALDAEGVPRRAVPVLDPHALADQLLVLGHDISASADGEAMRAATRLVVELRASV